MIVNRSRYDIFYKTNIILICSFKKYLYVLIDRRLYRKIEIGDNTCIKHVYQFYLIRYFVAYYLETDVPSCSKSRKNNISCDDNMILRLNLNNRNINVSVKL